MEYFEALVMGVTWFVAGFINTLSGMGAAMVAVPITSIWFEMQVSIAIACIVVPFLCLALAIKFRSHCDMKLFYLIMFSALPGAVIGSFILKYVPTLYLQILMAFFLLTYVAWKLFYNAEQGEVRENRKLLAVASFFSGITGAALSFFAPPLAMYVLYAFWSPMKTLGTLALATTFMSALTCLIQASLGIYTTEVLSYSAIAVPLALIGSVCAFPIVKHISQRVFQFIVLIIIALSGASAGIKACLGLQIF